MKTTCPTCTRPHDAPYRRIIDGKIVEGCIDACHGPHLAPSTNSGAWHNRSEARAWRREQGRGRQSRSST